jgi:hypothetical protein
MEIIMGYEFNIYDVTEGAADRRCYKSVQHKEVPHNRSQAYVSLFAALSKKEQLTTTRLQYAEPSQG